jgi:hypothetical protein
LLATALGRGRAGHPCLDLLDAAFEFGSGLVDRAGHDVVGAVAVLDVGQALGQGDGLAGEPTQLGFGAGAGVVSDQAGKTLVAERAKVAGAVERMEVGLDHGGA